MSEAAERLAKIRKRNRRDLGLDGSDPPPGVGYNGSNGGAGMAGLNGLNGFGRLPARLGVPAGQRGGGSPGGSYWRNGAQPRMGDLLNMNALAAGLPSPAQDPAAYHSAGYQNGTGNGWQFQRDWPSTFDPVPEQPALFQTMEPVFGGGAFAGLGGGPAFAGLGATSGVTAEQKGQITKLVKAAVAQADGWKRTGTGMDAPALQLAQGLIQAAQAQLASYNWSDSSWGVVGPAYDTRADLLKQLTEARNRLIARQGGQREDGAPMLSRQSVGADGKVRVEGSGNVYLDTAMNYPGAVKDRAGELGEWWSNFFKDATNPLKWGSAHKLIAAAAGGYVLVKFGSAWIKALRK